MATPMMAKMVHTAKQPIYPSVVTTRMRTRRRAVASEQGWVLFSMVTGSLGRAIADASSLSAMAAGS